jgi:hypothetical protein
VGTTEVDPSAVARSVWIATIIISISAAFLTLLVRRIYRALLRRSGMRLVSGALAVILSSTLYLAALFSFDWIASALLNPAAQRHDEAQLALGFVHRGPLHYLLPLAAIVLTWLVLSLRERRRSLATAG